MSSYLRIAKFLISRDVNGPGERFVIWFQGCPLRCKGCINPEFWDEEGGKLMTVEAVMEQITNNIGKIEGVTFTGGEPLIQGAPLVELAKKIKMVGLTLLCYSGYTYEEIKNGKIPWGKELLEWLDVLIDGPFEEEKKAPLLWRGSRNQRIHLLTEHYRYLETSVSQEEVSEVELQISFNELAMTGIFEIELWRLLLKMLRTEN